MTQNKPNTVDLVLVVLVVFVISHHIILTDSPALSYLLHSLLLTSTYWLLFIELSEYHYIHYFSNPKFTLCYLMTPNSQPGTHRKAVAETAAGTVTL